MQKVVLFTIMVGVASIFGVQLFITAVAYFDIDASYIGRQRQEELVPNADRVWFVGDVLLARSIERLMHSYGVEYPYSQLPPLPSRTLLVGNFESAVPAQHVPTPDFQVTFSVHRHMLSGLSQYGFTHLGLANNHALDFGMDDYVHTQQQLRSASTTPFGDPHRLSTSSIAFLELSSSTVALIGIHAVDSFPTEADVEQVLTYADTVSDAQVAYVHWGIEYQPYHSRAQERFARLLVAYGIDLVVGHHPHVVQDVALYEGVPVFYSLGNFIFDQYGNKDTEQGLILDVSFDGQEVQAALIPVSSEYSRGAPRVLSGFEKEQFLKNLAGRSAASLHDFIKAGVLTSVPADQLAFPR